MMNTGDDIRKRTLFDKVDHSKDNGVANFAYESKDAPRIDSCTSSLDSSSEIQSSDYNESGTDLTKGERKRKIYYILCATFLVKHQAVLYCFICAFTTSLSSIGVASLKGSVSPNEINFIRMGIQFLACLPLAVRQRIHFRYSAKAYLLLFARCAIGAFNSTLFFFIYQIMPVSTAKAIQYTAPIFAAFLGWLLLKESCSFVDTFLSFVSFGGVILVVQPPFVFQNVEGVEPIPDSTILGSVLCLVNACLVGLTFVILRKLSIYGIPPVTVLIVYSIVGMIFSGTLTTIFGQWTIPQCGLDRFTLIGNGVLLLSVQFMEYIALKTERASTVGLIRSSDIIFSFILEFLIFDIRPNALTIVGAFVIMASLVGLTVKKGCDKQPISENDDP